MPPPKLALKGYHMEKLIAVHEIIHKNPQEHQTIDGLALAVNTNRKFLVLGFKQQYGIGIYQYQVRLRLEKAKGLLEETDKPVKLIARLVGYDTENGFRKAFKKEFGILPTVCRYKQGE